MATLDQVIFVGTGVLSTVVAQVIIDAGAGPAWSQLLPLANYAGMALAGLYPAARPAGPVGRGGGGGGARAASAGGRDGDVSPGGGGGASGGAGAHAGVGVGGGALTHRSSRDGGVAASGGGGLVVVADADARDEGKGGPAAAAVAAALLSPLAGGAAGGSAAAPSAAALAVAGGPPSLSSPPPPPPPPPPLIYGVALTPSRYVGAAIVCDVLGFFFHVEGLTHIGSAVFQVLYASVVLFAAAGSRAVRGPSAALNALQWAGIGVVLAGLATSALGEASRVGALAGAAGGAAALSASSSSASSPSPSLPATGAPASLSSATPAAAAAHGGHAGGGATGTPLEVAWGVAASLLCAAVYGTMYTLAEALMSGVGSGGAPPARPPEHDGPALAVRIGGGITLLLGSYALLAVAPRWAEIAAAVAAAPPAARLSWPGVALGYATLLASAAAHAVTYYRVMEHTGAVAAGLMQAARAVGVFAASALFLCAASPRQCMTPARVAATALVCAGIYVFARGKAAAGGGGKGAGKARGGEEDDG